MADPSDVTKAAVAALSFATYPHTTGNKVKLYGLASDDNVGASGAFFDLANAIESAQHFIFIVDWSFQPFVRLKPRRGSTGLDHTAGGMLTKAACDLATGKLNDDMLVAVHAWQHPGVGPTDDQNDDTGKHLDEIAKLVTKKKLKKRPDNLLWRTSTRNLRGATYWSDWSIHQKFVVLDAADDDFPGKRVVKAFFGGLDITKGRFDFKEHPILPGGANDEPFLPMVSGKWDDWYNNEFADDRSLPREPWNDFYGQVVGPVAWDILREFVGRWNLTPNRADGDKDPVAKKRVLDRFLEVCDIGSPFVKAWTDHKGPFGARVLRSIESNEWGDVGTTSTPADDSGKPRREFEWRVNSGFEKSILDTYMSSIPTADRFIYIETQYFIGSGSRWQTKRDSVGNGVPGAIADRICEKIKADQPFHAYIVIPQFPEGNPVDKAPLCQRSYEYETMRCMAVQVFKALETKAAGTGKNWTDYLSFHFLMNWTDRKGTPVTLVGDRKARVGANQRYMVYVHSKLMIIDDDFLILGSANLNERSLAGNRDTEICLYLTADPGKLDDCKSVIQKVRLNAWKRHLGDPLPAGTDGAPESSACAQAFQQVGLTNWKNLSAGTRPDKSQLVTFPFLVTGTATSATFAVDTPNTAKDLKSQDPYIFDAEAKGKVPANGTTSEPIWSWRSVMQTAGVVDYPGLAE